MSSSERSIPHLRDIFSNYRKPTSALPESHQGFETHFGATSHADQNKTLTRSKRDNGKTPATGDVKTLERHLSMKKTIRKKIMRDLQQAFVDDPNEFKIENTNREKLRSEIRADTFRFGERPTRKSDNFLDMLRGGEKGPAAPHNSSYSPLASSVRVTPPPSNSNYNCTAEESEDKPSFWRRFTMKTKTKR